MDPKDLSDWQVMEAKRLLEMKEDYFADAKAGLAAEVDYFLTGIAQVRPDMLKELEGKINRASHRFSDLANEIIAKHAHEFEISGTFCPGLIAYGMATALIGMLVVAEQHQLALARDIVAKAKWQVQ